MPKEEFTLFLIAPASGLNSASWWPQEETTMTIITNATRNKKATRRVRTAVS